MSKKDKKLSHINKALDYLQYPPIPMATYINARRKQRRKGDTLTAAAGRGAVTLRRPAPDTEDD